MVAAGENKRWPRQIVSQFGIRLELGRFHKVRNLWADTPFQYVQGWAKEWSLGCVNSAS